MVVIESIFSEEILDSRGNPTIRATVSLSDGSAGSAIVPSGASTGQKEALELRDGDKSRYGGKGVLKACANIDELIAGQLIGQNPFNQQSIDDEIIAIDGTDNFANIGANAALGVSMAVAKAGANSFGLPLYRYLGGSNAMTLPVPMFNIINGGSHANNSVDFQEYMIMPVGFDDFKEALRAASEVYQTLKKIIEKMGESSSLGDEGGFAPNLKNNEEPIGVIIDAIEKSGYNTKEMAIALDVASSEFYKDGKYMLKSENRELSSLEMAEYLKNLSDKYPIVSIEDGLDENDWDGWKSLTDMVGDRVQLVGDDLFVTNAGILKDGIAKGVANSILIKPNQIGTISQTMETVRLASKNGYNSVMSHRSGESEDTFIADFAVALNTGQIKTGSTARGERTAKYNRLLSIANEIGNYEYIGRELFGV
jgi:enolase